MPQMVVDIPDNLFIYARIEADQPVTDEEFWELCAANPDLHLEREPNGEVVMVPPPGFETGYRNNKLSSQLDTWATRDGRGVAVDSSTDYYLPNGAARRPDASWVLKSRLVRFSKEEKRKFLHLCPDFVVELKSPSDRLPKLKAKMEEWIENGAQLGWLIDPDTRTVHIYRTGTKPEEVENAASIAGEDPVAGFVLDLNPIWQGL
jgi:Uma2 family endonuclease